ncbi:ERAD-associated E3 ubiquitin-protein ligase component HRD3A (AtSel1A) (Protein EMS-MUTAGENIZED BRI1 SUPPRESSOR 5) [Durusdinium trenchii]|uniref:ERAD-associated E3 ubiquitin-protein ligase component HRD3A (AtSel1A) (Protein EMS-MUTAGENIZED BRI1 SUPPRESSOR 5) n=1 Tax=Durusdinium trenchii TaxID=1381693 RepID=A0ABP0HCU0_9DINO
MADSRWCNARRRGKRPRKAGLVGLKAVVIAGILVVFGAVGPPWVVPSDAAAVGGGDEAVDSVRVSLGAVDDDESRRGLACLWEEIRVDWTARLPMVTGVHAAWGLAVREAETGQLLRRIRLEDAIRPANEGIVTWEDQQRRIRNVIDFAEQDVPAVGCQVLDDEWEASELLCGDGNHWPKLVQVTASPGYGDGSNFTFVFDRFTDEPAVNSTELVHSVIWFSGSIGNELRGEWTDPKTLVVHIVDSTGHVAYHEVGLHANIKTRERQRGAREISTAQDLRGDTQHDLILQGHQLLRLGFAARVVFELHVLDEHVSEAQSEVLQVVPCSAAREAETIVLNAAPAKSEPEVLREPVWRMQHQVALDDSKLKLPRVGDKVIPQFSHEVWAPSAWSLSFWIRLSEAGDDEQASRFRALVYHGLGKGHESGFRTPSLWLHPRSNRVALRVTTKHESDVGVDSEVEIPQNEWAHVALVVQNVTGGRFFARVLVNGHTIASMDRTDVLGGPGELHFGHDAWGPGPRALVRHVQLFDFALSRVDVARDMRDSVPLEQPWVRSSLRQQPSAEAVLSCQADDASQSLLGSVATVEDRAMTQVFLAEALQARQNGQRDKERSLLTEAARGLDGDALYELAHSEPRFGPRSLHALELARAQGHSRAYFELALLPEVLDVFDTPNANVNRSDIVDAADGRRGTSEGGMMLLDRMQIAALHGSVHAKLVLANEHRLKGECSAAQFYLMQVADEAALEHATRGEQPLVEMQVLHDFVDEGGERGDEDAILQYQILQADRGDVQAMVAMAGLFYWGARGLERDQPRAFRYFEGAAAAGHPGAQAACGNMLLKGEGVPEKNLTAALQYYHNAADQDNLEALNGLGYIYFFGHENIERNVSQALAFFERNLRDGDSLNNAAHIYLHEEDFRNLGRAMEYLARAADEYNSFGAAHTLGKLIATTETASCERSVVYLRKAALIGSWGASLRRGFDAFLARDMETSTFHYVEAAFMGYSRGAENAIWLLREQLKRLGDTPYERLFARIDSPMPTLQRLFWGDLRWAEGKHREALEAWTEASIDGDWSEQAIYRSQASYNLGIVAATHGQFQRAFKFLDRAASFVQAQESDEAYAARVALMLARWRFSALQYFHAYLPSFLAPKFQDIVSWSSSKTT